MTANMWAGGSCGDGLTWEISAKTLVISYDGEGTGVMDDYTSDNSVPWSSNRFDFFTISLPEGLTHIGDLAFKYCNMQSITIPASVTSIGKESFNICSSLTSVTFNTPSSLTTLGEKAFNATAITSITIPEGVTSIGKYCFTSCEQLESITLPSTLLSIDEYAFHMCYKLQSFTVPANVNNIGLEIFFECTDLASIVVDPSNTTFDSRDNCNAIIKTSTNTIIAACKNSDIPATVYGIQQEAFSGLDLGGRSIVIPEGVMYLDQSCFNSCYNASISIPKTVTSYGNFLKNPPFFGCSFSSITVDAENPKYDSRNNCNAIIETATKILVNGCQNTVIPEEVVEIGPGAFNSIHELTKITIPANVTKLGMTALANCDHLAEITCLATTPPNASASMVFWAINKAIPVYIPAGTLALYQEAAGWKDFTNFIEIGDQPEPEPLHEWICGGCVVTLDNGVLTIAPDPNADESSRGVMAFLSNMDNKEQHDWYEYRELVTKIVMADGVTNVSDKCFYGCSNATSARISNDVIYIGSNSFNGCSSLENIVIPVAVSSIDQDAFKGCTGMKDVYCYAAASWMGGNWFDQIGDDFKPSKATTCHVYADQLSTFLDYWGPEGSRDHLNLTFEGNLDAVLTMSDNAQEGKIDEFLDAHDGEVIPELTITRPVYCNNFYNTICLPFDMNEEQINNSSIAGAEIKAFKAARIEGGALILTLEVTNTIEAGVPYFISYSMADALESLTFKEVKLDAAPPAQTIVSNGVKFRGTYEKFHMEASHNYLFLGENNTLYWPSTAGDIKPFRAFFEIITAANAAIRRGMPARFEEKNSTTGIDNLQGAEVFEGKLLENGQLVIFRNGMKYNAAGQIVK